MPMLKVGLSFDEARAEIARDPELLEYLDPAYMPVYRAVIKDDWRLLRYVRYHEHTKLCAVSLLKLAMAISTEATQSSFRHLSPLGTDTTLEYRIIELRECGMRPDALPSQSYYGQLKWAKLPLYCVYPDGLTVEQYMEIAEYELERDPSQIMHVDSYYVPLSWYRGIVLKYGLRAGKGVNYINSAVIAPELMSAIANKQSVEAGAWAIALGDRNYTDRLSDEMYSKCALKAVQMDYFNAEKVNKYRCSDSVRNEIPRIVIKRDDYVSHSWSIADKLGMRHGERW